MALLEPSPRYLHYSAAFGKQVCVFGGCTVGGSLFEDGNNPAACVHIFDQSKETWKTEATTGYPPPGLYGGASTTINDHLYVYGGQDGLNYYDSLHRLDMHSLQWSELPSGPTRKASCRMISHEDKLLLFGGLDGKQCNNDLHCFEEG